MFKIMKTLGNNFYWAKLIFNCNQSSMDKQQAIPEKYTEDPMIVP